MSLSPEHKIYSVLISTTDASCLNNAISGDDVGTQSDVEIRRLEFTHFPPASGFLRLITSAERLISCV